VANQTFEWKKANVTVAKIEISHLKFEMILNVRNEVADKVRAKMAELNDCGTYPNEETTKAGGLASQFIISSPYNWNCRWRDFLTIINRLLDITAVELTEPQR